ncbi:MAG: RNA polymerase sigma factor [Chitinophagia bacterium]|jgi:RNA polymerase sigma factor (sigma-70 family)
MTEQEYNICVDEYSDGVFRFIVKNLRDEEDAKDIVQIAFEKLWMNKHNVASEKAKSYLFTVAYHQMIDHIRKEKRNHTLDQFHESDLVSQPSTNNELKQILLKAINELNPTQKSLVLLKDYEGYSYLEIGEIMNLSESQVKVYLHRARLFLKTRLMENEKVNQS